MHYWPTSLINAILQPGQRYEIANLRVSESTLGICFALTRNLPACTSMAIVRSEGAQFRRVYLNLPTQKDWLALERGGFVEAFDGFGFVMDALH